MIDDQNAQESIFMKIYTVGQVADKVGIPPGTVRQWEKSLEGVLAIPRDDKGARYYTEFEIDTLRRIKALRDKGVSFEIIREILSNSEAPSDVKTISALPVMSQSEAVKALTELQSVVQQLYQRMDEIVEHRVQSVLNERLSLLEESQAARDSRLEDLLAERDSLFNERMERDKQALESRGNGHVTYLTEQIELKNQETVRKMEESLQLRDQRLMETLRTMQEVAATQETKNKKKRFLGLF